MSDQEPTREAMERAEATGRAIMETLWPTKGNLVFHLGNEARHILHEDYIVATIARAIDEAVADAVRLVREVVEEDMKLLFASWEASRQDDQQAREWGALMERRRLLAKQPCGHPVACIVKSEAGPEYCAWCADVERQVSDAWEKGHRTPSNDIRHFRPCEGQMLTDAELGAIRERHTLREADKGPWHVYKSNRKGSCWNHVKNKRGDYIASQILFESTANSIASAPADINTLLDEVERLRGELGATRDALAGVEWVLHEGLAYVSDDEEQYREALAAVEQVRQALRGYIWTELHKRALPNTDALLSFMPPMWL